MNGPWYQNRNVFIVLACVCILVVIAFAATYSDYLGARIVGTKGARVSVSQGEIISLQLPKTLAPFVKIELCQEGKTPEQCMSLINKTSEKTLTITIPVSAALGKATIKVTERTAKGVITKNILMRRPILITKAKPTPVPAKNSTSSSNSSGGSSSGSEGSSSESSSSQSNIPATNYELTHLCYESDQTVHISWKPPKNIVRFRKSGESTWLPNVSECGISGCKDVASWHFSDYNNSIIYISSSNPLSPNTNFEFQIVPYTSSPDGNSENSQIYKYNSGPLPVFGDCRSLL